MPRFATLRTLAAVALIALGSIPAVPMLASAQQAVPTDAQRQRARELYGQGQSHFEAGRFDEARAELERAMTMTKNAKERSLFLERAEACARSAAARTPTG